MADRFVPDDFAVPTRFELPGFHLEPLGAEHNERDHAAWMSSVDHIRATPGFSDWDWPEPMTLEGASFKLRIDGRKVGAGVTSEAVEVPGLDSHVLAVTFRLNNVSALLRLREVIERHAFDYELTGKLYSQGPWGRRSLKVNRLGHLDLDEVAGGQIGDAPDLD